MLAFAVLVAQGMQVPKLIVPKDGPRKAIAASPKPPATRPLTGEQLQKLLKRSVKPFVALSAARTKVEGKGALSIWFATHVDVAQDSIDFGPVGESEPEVEVQLQGLKSGAPYLAVFTGYAAVEKATFSGPNGDQALSFSDGTFSLPILFTPDSKTTALYFTWAAGTRYAGIGRIEVYAVGSVPLTP